MTASRIRLALVGVALILTAGCGGGYGKKLVGTWEPAAGTAEKDNPFGSPTIEFKADGGFRIAVGSEIEMTGTYKVVKEDGKVVTVEAEMTGGKFGGMKIDPKEKKDDSKKTFTVTFEDDDNITMSNPDKGSPDKLKRKK